AGLADLPVQLALVPAVGHHQRVVAVEEAVDIDPGAKGEGVKLAGDAEADAVADAFELEALLTGPAAGSPGGADDGAVPRLRRRPGLIHERAAEEIGRFEGEIGQACGIFAAEIAGATPLIVALLQSGRRARRQLVGRGKRR